MERDKILIIADNVTAGAQISSMLPLTRFDDSINVIICQEIEYFESVTPPKLILLHSNDSTLETLKQIKSLPLFNDSKILLLMEEANDEFLCNAFDIGIDDYLITFNETTLFLKVLLMLKIISQLANSTKSQLLKTILSEKCIMDTSMVYYYDQMKDPLKKFLKDSKNKYDILMLSPTLEAKDFLAENIVFKTLTSSIRSEDIAVFINSYKLCIIFKDVDESRIKKFYEKLKNNFEALCSIYAVSAQVNDDLDFVIMYLEKILDDNLKSGLEYAFFSDISDAKYLGDYSSGSQDNEFIQNQKKFFKAYKELVTPYLFRTQTVMEAKYSQTKIDHRINEDETVFSLTQGFVYAELKITYPAASRINTLITMNKSGEQNTIKNFYEINDFNESTLDSIFATLFNEYEKLITE